MMLRQSLWIIATVALIALCTVLPFLPGQYDSLAVPLSTMAQVLGIVGLLLVPVGVIWMAYEFAARTKGKRYVFAIISLIAASIVAVLVSLATMFESPILGIGALALWAYILTRIMPRVTLWKGSGARVVVAGPLYLVIVPIAAFLISYSLADAVTEFSRDRAIRNSAPLIADIEQYRVANGVYPRSLISVHRDYLPSIIGIKEYRYEPTGESYNVMFEQHTLWLGVKEIVVYNPRDEQAISSHAMDVLQLTPEQLALDRTRGHNSERPAPHPHWKIFWFD